ncbi:FtsX-like permease family protein [Catelliglobosispora koreensis]|uniref:FtsX-like permease family protein n=1 Tax=Catelliglobosispora koreensis TaxID=129052 RepID=UPI00036F2BB7|nr:FtsX-like permease family protein [Catelliglobosispora koreensis]
MKALAVRSLRHRYPAAVATFIAALLGTAMMASFATLVESAFSAHEDDRELLIIMGGVVGGWSTVIVLFSIASTVGIVAEQRVREAGLLRTIGATPKQVRALIVYEAMVVTLFAAAAGVVVALAGGPALFDALQRGNLITSASSYDASLASPSMAAGVVVVVGTVAAWISSRRATRGAATFSLRQAEVPVRRLRWWRILLGALLIASGLASAIVTITVTGKATDAYAAMQTSGSASIVAGVGLAALAPWLLRVLATPLRPLLSGSGSGHLAVQNLTRRAGVLAGMLAPVIVFVSTAVGTLLMVGIDDRTLAAAGDPEGVGDTIAMINAVVIGMISLFSLIMVVNATVAVVVHRRPELDRLWRLGATARQLRTSVVLEAVVVAVLGIGLGLLGAMATAVPYSVVRHEGLVPNGQLWLPPFISAVAVIVTAGAAWGAQRRAAR